MWTEDHFMFFLLSLALNKIMISVAVVNKLSARENYKYLISYEGFHYLKHNNTAIKTGKVCRVKLQLISNQKSAYRMEKLGFKPIDFTDWRRNHNWADYE